MKTIEIKTGVKILNKQEAIRKAISDKIMSGEYGKKLPSVRELAEIYAVNVITLRKALSSLVKEGVIYTEKGKGTYVNNRTSACIGIIGLPREEFLFDKGEYFGDVFSGIREEIEKNNDFFSYQLKQPGKTYRELIRENPAVSGFIIFAPLKTEERELLEIRGLIPYVVVGTTLANKRINSVDSDNYKDSYDAVNMLIKEGKRNILFLSDRMLTRTHEYRYQGYLDALSAYGIKVDKALIIAEDVERNQFKDEIRALFNSHAVPDAVFAASCISASKMLELDEIHNRDYKLIVYDDPRRRLSIYGIKYGVIQQPLHEIGTAAMDMLYRLIRNKSTKAEHVRLSSRLINIEP